MAKIHIAKAEQKAPPTKKEIEDAGADARHLMQESRVLAMLVSTDIAIRQLFLHVRAAIEDEVRHRFETENPDLIIQALVMSAERKATVEPSTPRQIRQDLLQLVLPVVDIFCSGEEANDKSRVHRSDDSSEAGVGGVLPGTGGDAELEAGERSEGGAAEA